MLSLFYFCCVAALFSVLGLLPKVLSDRGIAQPGLYASVLTAAMVVFNILGGLLSDRFGRGKILTVSVLVFGAVVPGILLASGLPLIACLFVAGAAAGPIIPVTTAIPVEMPSIGPASAGTALGILFMIGNLGGFFGPMFVGWTIETLGSPWAGFSIVIVLLFVAPLFLRSMGKGTMPQGAAE